MPEFISIKRIDKKFYLVNKDTGELIDKKDTIVEAKKEAKNRDISIKNKNIKKNKLWILVSSEEQEEIDYYLTKGFEPFQVTGRRVYLKKKVK